MVETEHRAMDQPRGVELDYRVVALNKAGTGAASGIVTAVLLELLRGAVRDDSGVDGGGGVPTVNRRLGAATR